MGTKNIIGELTINGSQVLTAAAMKTIVLFSSEWTNNEQTVSVEGVTADNNILVSTSGDPTAYAEAGIYCSAQADGSLTFKCTTTPTEDVLVSVYIGGSISGENEITVDEGMSDVSTNPVQNKVIKAYVDEKAGGGGSKLYKHIVTVRNNDSENLFEKTIYNSSPDKILTQEQIIKYIDFEGTFQDQNASYITGTVFTVVAGTGEVVILETPKTGWLLYANNNGESGLILTYNGFINYMPGTGVYLNIPYGAKATIDGEEKSISTVEQGMPIGIVGDPDYDCFHEPAWEPLDPAKMVFTDTVTEMGASGGSGSGGSGALHTCVIDCSKFTYDETHPHQINSIDESVKIAIGGLYSYLRENKNNYKLIVAEISFPSLTGTYFRMNCNYLYSDDLVIFDNLQGMTVNFASLKDVDYWTFRLDPVDTEGDREIESSSEQYIPLLVEYGATIIITVY